MATPRIDSHQHFWRYEPREFAWIDERMAAIRRDFPYCWLPMPKPQWVEPEGARLALGTS